MAAEVVRLPLRLSRGARVATPLTTQFDFALAGRPVAPLSARLLVGAQRQQVLVDVRRLTPPDESDQRVELAWIALGDHTEAWLEVDLAPAADAPAAWAFPLVQWTPQPGAVLDATIEGRLVARYHYAPVGGKPFLHPLLGPAGVALTGMGHPAGAEGRLHQHGVWLAHRDLNGVNFWEDRPGQGRQRHLAIGRLDDGPVSASAEAVLAWETPEEHRLLTEHRTWRLWALPNSESALDLTTTLRAGDTAVRLGRTPFGLLGVRVGRTMTAERGGAILTATGDRGEGEALHRRARWCDYSGPVAPGVWNGIAVLDHPANLDHPCPWQVRDDGWLGPAPCYEAEHLLAPGAELTLRYRLLTHGSSLTPDLLDEHSEGFADPPTVTWGRPEVVAL